MKSLKNFNLFFFFFFLTFYFAIYKGDFKRVYLGINPCTERNLFTCLFLLKCVYGAMCCSEATTKPKYVGWFVVLSYTWFNGFNSASFWGFTVRIYNVASFFSQCPNKGSGSKLVFMNI